METGVKNAIRTIKRTNQSLCSFYTIQVPDDLLSYEPKIQPAIGNNPIWLNWSETGSEGVIVWWQYTLTVRHKLPRSMSIYLL